jgi:hypothetical protein
MSGWLKIGLACAIILLLTSAKKIAHSPQKLLTKFAHNEQINCEQDFAQ